MSPKTVILLFAVGSFVGIPLAISYIAFAQTKDRFFHAFVLAAALCVSFPAVVIFIRSTLKLLAIAIKNERSMDELGDVAKDAKDVIKDIKEIIADVKIQDPKKIVEFVDKLATDGTLEKIAGSVEKVAERIGEAIKKVEAKAVDRMVDGL